MSCRGNSKCRSPEFTRLCTGIHVACGRYNKEASVAGAKGAGPEVREMCVCGGRFAGLCRDFGFHPEGGGSSHLEGFEQRTDMICRLI